jgi:hypothetical protein
MPLVGWLSYAAMVFTRISSHRQATLWALFCSSSPTPDATSDE